MRRFRGLPLARRRFAAALALGVALTAGPALAFKWAECPAPPLPRYPSRIGATTSPFIHPGHALTIVLNEAEVKRSGGFATTAGGNVVRVTFDSLYGSTIDFPDVAATATSTSSLTFRFPDSTETMGRPLAGPAKVDVFVGSRQVAAIDSRELVALPPTNDANTVLTQGVYARAAIGADGDIWVPVHFTGPPWEIPLCDGLYVQPSLITVKDACLEGLGEMGEMLGNLLTADTTIDGYLGDMTINGIDFYGWPVPEQIRPTIGPTGELIIERMNDSTDLVLRISGNNWLATKLSPELSKGVPLSLAKQPLSAPADPSVSLLGAICDSTPAEIELEGDY